MKTKIFIGLVASLVALAALWVAWQGFRQARLEEAALTAIARNQAALDRSERQARETAAARPAAPADAAKPATSGKPPSLPSLLAADPKLMALYLKSFRAALPDRYGATYARIHLSPAVIDKFEEITTAQEGENMDLKAAAEAQGLTADDPGIAAMQRQANLDYRAQVTALAVEAGINPTQVKGENRLATSDLQNLMGSLATTVALSPTPMTYAQLGQLGPILAAASPSFQSGGSIDRFTLDWDKALADASAVLPPVQLDGLRVMGNVFKVQAEAKQFHNQAHPAVAP